MTDDRDWLYSNIGNAAAEIGTLDLIDFVDPDNRRSPTAGGAARPETASPALLPPELIASILRAMSDPRATNRAHA